MIVGKQDALEKSAKIWVAGGSGMAGSAIVRKLMERGYSNIIGLRSRELDLRRQQETEAYIAQESPDCVILAAARVGGIQANMNSPVEFLYDNLAIQNHVIYSAAKHGVRRLIFLASSCVYPRLSPQPMREEYLLDGKPEPTNEGYALAKIAGLKLCEFINQQYGYAYISVMPCNLYGPGDNFDPIRSHVVPALIRKVHEAKITNAQHITLWGTGKARREVMYSDDLADACVFLLENAYSDSQFLNVGTGIDMTIQELAEIIMDVVGYRGELRFDSSKPDGMPRKVLDVSRINALGWQAKTSLRLGLEKTYLDYLERASAEYLGTE